VNDTHTDLSTNNTNNKPFTIRLPDRSEWDGRFQPDRKEELVWYTDNSKINEGTTAGLYGYGTRRNLSFSLGQYTTVFPAEVSECHQGM
jgi:hypothetical protein